MKIWNLPVPLICSILATGALSLPGPTTQVIDLEALQSSSNNTDDSTIIKSGGLFRRAEPQLQKCPDGIPFSCPKTSKCTPTTPDKDSVICCPAGGNCNFIKPVACDVRQQDPKKYPAALLHTKKLDAKLEKCGGKCCPLGYGCEDGMCAIKKEKPGTKNAKASASPTSKGAPKPTDSPGAKPSRTPAHDAQANKQSEKNSSKSSQFPPGAVVLGIFVGLAIGVGLAVLVFFLLRRRKQKKTKTLKRQSSNFMGTTPTEPKPNGGVDDAAAAAAAAAADGRSNSPNHKAKGSNSSNVSEPMWAPNYGPPTHRTDFLLRRGDVETGMERNNANDATPDPNTASNLERGMSKRGGGINIAGIRKPNQAHQQPSMTTRRGSRLPPLFATPLKLGLPSSPRSPRSPGSRVRKMRPQRPRRSDEPLKSMLAQSQGQTRSTAEAVSNSNNGNTTIPKVAPATANHERYGYQPERQRNDYTLDRSDSDTTILSESPLEDPDAKAKEWGLSTTNPFTRSRDKQKHDRDYGHDGYPDDSRIKSTETINVMFQTPELEQQRKAQAATIPSPNHERRDTTFEDLMKQAGWSPRSDWNDKRNVPEVPKIPEAHGGKKWGFR